MSRRTHRIIATLATTSLSFGVLIGTSTPSFGCVPVEGRCVESSTPTRKPETENDRYFNNDPCNGKVDVSRHLNGCAKEKKKTNPVKIVDCIDGTKAPDGLCQVTKEIGIGTTDGTTYENIEKGIKKLKEIDQGKGSNKANNGTSSNKTTPQKNVSPTVSTPKPSSPSGSKSSKSESCKVGVRITRSRALAVGEQLHAKETKCDTYNDIELHYQWQRSSIGGYKDITGATNKDYVLQDADFDKTIRVSVMGLQGTYQTSAHPPVVSAPTDSKVKGVISGTVTITSDAKLGKEVTVDISKVKFSPAKSDGKIKLMTAADPGRDDKYSGAVSVSAGKYKYKVSQDACISFLNNNWKSKAKEQSHCEIQFNVEPANDKYVGQLHSNKKAVALNDFDSVGKVSITGTPKVGKTLTAKVSGFKPAIDQGRNGSYDYQWKRDDNKIDGATKSTYQVKDKKDEGHAISVQVTAKRLHYNTKTITSSPVNVPKAKATATPKASGSTKKNALADPNASVADVLKYLSPLHCEKTMFEHWSQTSLKSGVYSCDDAVLFFPATAKYVYDPDFFNERNNESLWNYTKGTSYRYNLGCRYNQCHYKDFIHVAPVTSYSELQKLGHRSNEYWTIPRAHRSVVGPKAQLLLYSYSSNEDKLAKLFDQPGLQYWIEVDGSGIPK